VFLYQRSETGVIWSCRHEDNAWLDFVTYPIPHPRIKEYLNFVCVEQAGMATSPSQAVPLYFVKFQNLIAHLQENIVDSQSLSKILFRYQSHSLVSFVRYVRVSSCKLRA